MTLNALTQKFSSVRHTAKRIIEPLPGHQTKNVKDQLGLVALNSENMQTSLYYHNSTFNALKSMYKRIAELNT